MRVLAEYERMMNFHNVLREGGLLYYRVLRRILIEKVYLAPAVRFIVDYMKIIIENGMIFDRDTYKAALE